MMVEKIAVVVDSGSDVPPAVLAQYDNIAVVPLTVTIDGQDFHDGVDLTPAAFYQRLRAGGPLPQTASPSPFAVQEQMQALFNAGYTRILGITISSALSATNRTFELAAHELPAGVVTVLDTKSIGIGSGLQAVYALEMIADGVAFTDIVARVQASIQKSHVYFYVPTLTYLQAGGRIGRVAGLVGSVLKIKPVISCGADGVYYVVSKSRSEAKAMGKMVAQVSADYGTGTDVRVAVAHGDNPALLASVSAALAEATGRSVDFQGDISPSLGVHTGPGLIGVGVGVR